MFEFVGDSHTFERIVKRLKFSMQDWGLSSPQAHKTADSQMYRPTVWKILTKFVDECIRHYDKCNQSYPT